MSGQIAMFAERQQRCAFCGAAFVPFSLALFKMAVKMDMPDAAPETQTLMAKTGFQKQVRYCCFDHYFRDMINHQRETENEIWERYLSKIR